MKSTLAGFLRPHVAAVCCASFVWLSPPLSAAEINSTWNNTTGNWSDAARWLPAVVPNNTLVDQFNAVFGGGAATLTEAITLNRLTQTAGAINGDFNLTTLIATNLSGGSHSGAGSTIAQGTLTISGSFGLDAGRVLRNEGTGTWTAGQINLNANNAAGHGTITNIAGATFNASSNGNMNMVSSNFGGADTGATAAFNNAGSFTKSGTGTVSLNVEFNNSGTLEVQGGTLNLGNGGTSTGAFVADTGTRLSFNGGTHTLTGGSVNGQGTIAFDAGTTTLSGTFNVAGTTEVSGGTFTLESDGITQGYIQTSGTLGGTGDLTVTGTAALSGGQQTGSGVTTLQGTTSITGSNSLDANRTLRNEGTANWSAGQINLNGNNVAGHGTITNAVGATFNASSNGGLNLVASNFGGTDTGATAAFNNQGAFVKGSAGTASIGVDFNNTGSVAVQGGTLALNDGGTSTGTFAASSGATLDFGGGTHDLSDSSITGAGTARFSGGAANFAGTYNVTGTTAVSGGTFNLNSNGTTGDYNQTSGTLGGTGNLNVTGIAALSGGQQTGGGITTLQGTTSITGSNSLDANRTLRNEGTANWSAGQINLNGNNAAGHGTITNAAGATFNVSSNGGLNLVASNFGGADTGATAAFNNQGAFAKSGAGTTTVSVDFNNAGSVAVQAGTLALNDGGTSTGTFAASSGATLEFGGGTHDLTSSSVTGAGTARFSGGTTNFTGTYNVTGATAISGGTFNLNSNGTTAEYNQTSGALAGTGNLNVTGSAALSGGQQTGGGITTLQGTTSITGSNSLDANRTLRNEGTATWTAGQINLNGNNAAGHGTFTNAAGATFTSSSNSSLNVVASNFGGPDNGLSAAFNNQGTFVKSGTGTTTVSTVYNNPGSTDVQAGTLTLSGPVTQHNGTTLTGGTWIVRGGATLAISTSGAQNITTNQGDVTLRGAGSSFARIDTLTDNQGAFRVLDDRNFTAVAGFTNSGELELGGGTFSAPTLTNTSAGVIHGNGTLAVRPANAGTIRADGGTLALTNGAQSTATTSRLESTTGATLDLSGGASGSRAGFLVNDGSLAVGTNVVTVDRDYTNASFGTGNSFNARANVTGTGAINAAGNVAQAITGADVTNGTAATATLALGNLHVGDSVSVNYAIANTGSTGPDLRGAIQTSVNGGNLTDARLSGAGVTAGNFGPVAAGGSQTFGVTFTGTTAGALTGQQVAVVNNFNNVGDQTLQLTGGVYRLAEATLGNLSFGNVLVGSSQTRFLSVSNSALADLFSEGLDASFGNFSGMSAGLLSGTGTLTNLAAGSTNNTTLAVTLNTSAAGTVTASVQVLLASNGATTSGLGITALPSQNIPISGLIQLDAQVGNLASASAAAPNPVNLGNVRVGDASPSQAISLTNIAVGPAEGLNASISTASAGITATGSFNNLVAGATNATGLIVGLDTTTAGAKSGLATIALASDGTFNNGVTTALTPQTVAVNGAVYLAADAGALPLSVNLGTVRTGTVVDTALALENVAANTNGFTETLGASFGTTNAGLTGVGSASGIATGETDSTAMAVRYTAGAAGAYSGAATVNFVSEAINNSGLGTLGVGAQTINFTGTVNALADFGLVNNGSYTLTQLGANAALLDFGLLSDPALLATSLSVLNLANGPADSLLGTIDLTGLGSSAFSFLGATTFDLGAGDALPFQLTFDPNARGLFTGTLTFDLASHNAFQSDLALDRFTLQLRGRVATNNQAVPDTGHTLTLLTLALAGLVALRRRCLY